MNPHLRSFTLATLLVVLPFSGIRVICIESVPAGSDPSAGTEAKAEIAHETPTDCERLCPFHPPTSTESPDAEAVSAVSDEESDCALSSDGAAQTMLGTIAVLRPSEPLVIPYAVSSAPTAASSVYADPALAHLGPPPKPQAL